MTGRIFTVIGASGVGKDTLLAGLCTDQGPHWVRRVITRPETLGGEPYAGVSAAEFARRARAGDFALVWRAHGLAYGIAHAELVPRALGRDVIFNGSRGALGQALAVFADLIVIHVTAPAHMRAARLAQRGREDPAAIAQRLARQVDPWPAGVQVIDVANDADPQTGILRLRAALQALPVRAT